MSLIQNHACNLSIDQFSTSAHSVSQNGLVFDEYFTLKINGCRVVSLYFKSSGILLHMTARTLVFGLV